MCQFLSCYPAGRYSSKMLRVCLTLALFSVVLSHLCLLDPHQRGPMMDNPGINKAGCDECGLMKAPCGGMEAMMPTVSYTGGLVHNFTFQKNLCHYNPKMPGTLDMYLFNVKDMTKGMKLKTIMDTNTTSPYLYVESVMLPKKRMEHAVLQVVYNTSNPQAPPMFYQCADILVAI